MTLVSPMSPSTPIWPHPPIMSPTTHQPCIPSMLCGNTTHRFTTNITLPHLRLHPMVHRHHCRLHLEHHHRRHQGLITEFWVWHHPHRHRQAKSELHLGDGCGLRDLEGRNTEVRETKGQLSMALTLVVQVVLVVSMVLIQVALGALVASTVLIMAAPVASMALIPVALEGLVVPMDLILVAPEASTVLIMAALEGLAVPMAGHHTPNGK